MLTDNNSTTTATATPTTTTSTTTTSASGVGSQQYQQHHHSAKYNSHRGDNESNINHVVLITVINPNCYTINCDLIHHICSSYGKVNRIVIFKKNGVQAMVEFDSVESAKRAKLNLHGCDIYSGCCTLRIEYAKPTRLNVHKNGNDSFDYTNPNLGNEISHQQDGNQTVTNLNEPMLVSGVPTAPDGSGPPAVAGLVGGNGQMQVHHHQQSYNGPSHVHHQSQVRNHAAGGRRGGNNVGANSAEGGSGQRHGQHQNFHPSHHHHHHPHMHQQHNPHGKPGEAPVGYAMGHTPLDPTGVPSGAGGDPSAAFHQQDGGFNVSRSGPPSSYVEQYLQTAHAGVAAPPYGQPYPRHDGGHHHQHHHHHHHHQRSNLGPSGGGPGGGHANHHHSSFATGNVPTNALISGPGTMGPPQGTVMMVYGLHPERVNCDRLFNLFCLYGNVIRIKFLRSKEGCAMVQMGDILAVDSAPVGITEDELLHLFKQTSGLEPVSLKIFTPKGDNTKSYSGLITFRDSAEATEALILCNHMSMPKPGATHPYILRLCFSPPTYPRANPYVQTQSSQ